jgi:uncharacterized protein
VSVATLTKDAILRIGEVCAVDGRRIYIQIDKNKNLSDIFLDGDILRNISVNSYVEIRKGFLSIIGRVEGEKQEEERFSLPDKSYEIINRNKRILTVSLSGYIDESGTFTGGAKELPLIGNEAYIISQEKIRLVHNLVADGAPSISFAELSGDDFNIEFPVDGLFNSHIAIFGNTDSGKSNTLAYLYQELMRTLSERNAQAFQANAHFVLFDFNGEYTPDACISRAKTVYSMSTRDDDGDRIPLDEDGLVEIVVLSILADATDKTQRPFLRRMLNFYQRVMKSEDPEQYARNILKNRVREVLRMSDKVRTFQLIDYFRELLPSAAGEDGPVDLIGDLE